MDVEEEASEKPIIKNGMFVIFHFHFLIDLLFVAGNGLNVSMGENAQINGDCTVVTYLGEKEEDDVKKEAAVEEEEKEEKKDVEKKVEEEKKEEEVKEEEKKEEDEVEEAKETDPLKEESESK